MSSSVSLGRKVRVFVSSTLRECARERTTAKKAILSLNHLPLLFEDLGATPHPPRSEYLRLLAEAHIFVGIYKDSYGWVEELSRVVDQASDQAACSSS